MNPSSGQYPGYQKSTRLKDRRVDKEILHKINLTQNLKQTKHIVLCFLIEACLIFFSS
jgi:hypothetical protein